MSRGCMTRHHPGYRGAIRNARDIPDRTRDEQAIRAVEAAYDAAWDAGDLDALIAGFGTDTVVVDPFGGLTAGRGEVVRSLEALFAGGARGSTHRSRIDGVRCVTDDVAVVDGEATLDGLPDSVTGRAGPISHRFTDILVRQGGTWRIAQVPAYVFMLRPRS